MGRLSDFSIAAMLGGWVLLADGCAGPPAVPSGPTPARPATPALPSPSPPPQAASDKRFIIAPELAGILHVVRVILHHPPDAYLKIQVTLQNMTEMPQGFSYRIEWFNAEGVKLPLDSEEFIPWMLMPHEVSSIAVTAPSPAAADFGIAFVPTAK